MKRLHGGILTLLAGLLALSTTGCMIGPTNYEDIYSIENKMSPGGFVLDGNMLIEVQAFHPDRQRWETVATTRSSSGSSAWEGYNWHYWQSPQFRLAYEYWIPIAGRDLRAAKLRAIADGEPLYTFEEWNLGSLSDMLEDINGRDVIIIGRRFQVD